MARTPGPSIELGKAGLKFRKQILKDFVIEERHDLKRLDLAAHCLDRIAECQDIVKKEGLIILDRFEQKKEHPAAKIERDNKTLFVRILRELGLDLEKQEESRPPAQY